MQAIEKDLSVLRESVEAMHAAEEERIGAASVGDVVRQGDLYLVCLAEMPSGQPKIEDRQLAPGTTQGSRHVLAGDCVISKGSPQFVRKATGAEIPAELIGPVFSCRSDCTVTHPEHGDKVLPSGTAWAVVYQRDHAEEVRRVRD